MSAAVASGGSPSKKLNLLKERNAVRLPYSDDVPMQQIQAIRVYFNVTEDVKGRGV